MKPTLLTLALCLATFAPLSARESTPAILREAAAYLSSPELEGRMTGTPGALKAADYLAAELQKLGYQPGGDNGTFFHTFEYTSGVRLRPGENRLSLQHDGAEPQAFEADTAFRPLALSGDGEAAGEVVFAGYGLRSPGERENGYDSYAGLDVKGKIVLVFRYVPEDAPPERKAELNRYAGLRYKAMLAREHGAAALLVVTGPRSPGAGELAALSSDAGTSGSDLPVLSISKEIAEALFASSGKTLEETQRELDRENPHFEGSFPLPGTRVALKTSVERLRKQDRNVIGRLPGKSDRWLLLGAHYDHLGHGEAGAMNRKGEENHVHPGADDNASGCAVVLDIAQRLATTAAENPLGVQVAFWSGEEIGVLGSTRYAESHPLEHIAAYLNFDMVGRLRENRLSLQGAGSSADWKALIEKANVRAGFALNIQEDPYLPTDVTAFYPKGVVVLNFFTGAHDDYHRPTDTEEKLNYPGMARIATFAEALARAVAARPEPLAYAKVVRAARSMEGRDRLRIGIGSIPDYTAEVTGVKLAGVRAGSPADKAGLRNGDIIIHFAGQKIANVYDYTYALDAARAGQPTPVVILREGKEVELSVTPEGRK